MAFTIEKMIQNKEFNRRIMKAVREEEQYYLNGFLESFQEKKQDMFEELIGAKKEQFSYVQLVVTAHITLITKALLEVEPSRFKRISESEE